MFIAEPQITRNLPGFRFHCKLGTQTTFVKRLLRFASPLRNFSPSFPCSLLFSLSLSNLPEFLKLFPHCSGARRTHKFGLKNLPKILCHGVNLIPGESRQFFSRKNPNPNNPNQKTCRPSPPQKKNKPQKSPKQPNNNNNNNKIPSDNTHSLPLCKFVSHRLGSSKSLNFFGSVSAILLIASIMANTRFFWTPKVKPKHVCVIALQIKLKWIFVKWNHVFTQVFYFQYFV